MGIGAAIILTLMKGDERVQTIEERADLALLYVRTGHKHIRIFDSYFGECARSFSHLSPDRMRLSISSLQKVEIQIVARLKTSMHLGRHL